VAYSQRRSDLLAAIDRRLWRDLGFADPEPAILPFLPSLVVAWADGQVGEAEADTIRERAAGLSAPLKEWIGDRLRFPPGPYFRYQVSHLLAFLECVWHHEENGKKHWAACGTEWADDLIQEAGWLRRLFGGLNAEIRDLKALRRVMDDGDILTSDRIWALARGTHAEAEPHRGVAVVTDHDQSVQAVGIVLQGPEERHALGTFLTIIRDDDLDEDRVRTLLLRTQHLREPERWIVLALEVNARGRTLTRRQSDELREAFETAVGGEFEECEYAELAYLEDALAVDARWMSWVPGRVEELRIDREEVTRTQAPGTFHAPRSRVQAHVAQQPVAGPPGLGFRVLHIEGEGGASLRLASPVILQEPATRETVSWIARFLPEMCDPHTQLVLDEEGPRWVAEVHTHMPSRAAVTLEPLLPGRSLLVPPWIWFRAAGALGVRFFAGKRKVNPPA
jgi:hypothetical protein